MSCIPDAYWIAVAQSLKWLALGCFIYLVLKGWSEIMLAKANKTPDKNINYKPKKKNHGTMD